MKFNLILVLLLSINSCKPYSITNESHKLTSEGDYLKVTYGGEADSVVFKMYNALELTLKEYSDNQFSGELEIPGIDTSKFGYQLEVYKKNEMDILVKHKLQPSSTDEHFIWVGPNCNAFFIKADTLEGELITKSIYSNSLNEDRPITIYNPKKFYDDTPIVYMADGQVVEQYAPYVDDLISRNLISPVKLVGIHSSKYRNTEYFYRVIKKDRFNNHAHFFLNESIAKMEQELDNWGGERYLYGVSNGAAFCLYASIIKPELFDEIIAFSAGGGLYDLYTDIKPKDQFSPSYYMAAGRYEKGFLNSTKLFRDILESNNYEVSFKELISGHDYNAWRIEFLEYLEKTFSYEPN